MSHVATYASEEGSSMRQNMARQGYCKVGATCFYSKVGATPSETSAEAKAAVQPGMTRL